jgi:hypothetical protein
VVNATKFSDVLISLISFLECFNEYPLHFVNLSYLDGKIYRVFVVFTQVLYGFIIGFKAPDDLDGFACHDKFLQAAEKFQNLF